MKAYEYALFYEGVIAMAFGQKLKEKVNIGGNSEGTAVFETQFVDRHAGIRLLRVLPGVDEEGNILNEPDDEVVFRETWWTGLKGGVESKVRVFLDWKNPFSDPLWAYVAKNYEKGSQERRGFKTRFAINVIDKTPVMFTEEGQLIYPDEKNQFVRIANSSKVLPKPLVGEAKPLNKIRILEGSSGPEGGKHDLQSLFDLGTSIEGPDGEPKKLHEVDIKLKTTGEGIKTNRSFFITANFQPISPVFLAMPRYDIASWVKPWPHDALNDLLEGRDLLEIFEEYNISTYPSLMESSENDIDFTNPEAYTGKTQKLDQSTAKKSRKKSTFEE